MADTDEAMTVLIALQITLGIFGVLGNSTVCLTIGRTKSLHDVTNLMVLNLAAADTLASLISIPESFVTSASTARANASKCYQEYLDMQAAAWPNYFLRCFLSHSVLGLTLATFERFTGITRPLHYAGYFSRRRVAALLLVVWTLPPLVEAPFHIYLHAGLWTQYCDIIDAGGSVRKACIFPVLTLLLFALPASCMVFMYAKILANLRRNARHLRRQGMPAPARELLQAQRKVTHALVLIAGAFFLLVMPCKIWLILFSLNVMDLGRISKRAVTILSVANSAINPVLYGFKYEQLRNAFWAMVYPNTWHGHTQKVSPHPPSVQTISK